MSISIHRTPSTGVFGKRTRISSYVRHWDFADHLTDNEKVFLADILSAFPDLAGKFGLRIDDCLQSLVHTETVDVQLSDYEAREMVNLGQNF